MVSAFYIPALVSLLESNIALLGSSASVRHSTRLRRGRILDRRVYSDRANIWRPGNLLGIGASSSDPGIANRCADAARKLDLLRLPRCLSTSSGALHAPKRPVARGSHRSHVAATRRWFVGVCSVAPQLSSGTGIRVRSRDGRGDAPSSRPRRAGEAVKAMK